MAAKKIFFVLIAIVLTCYSCSKDHDDVVSLFGNWVEDAPVTGRTRIYFLPQQEMRIIYKDGSQEKYYYKVDSEANTIFLNRKRGEKKDGREFFFIERDENSFSIEDFYAITAETETTDREIMDREISVINFKREVDSF